MSSALALHERRGGGIFDKCCNFEIISIKNTRYLILHSRILIYIINTFIIENNCHVAHRCLDLSNLSCDPLFSLSCLL